MDRILTEHASNLHVVLPGNLFGQVERSIPVTRKFYPTQTFLHYYCPQLPPNAALSFPTPYHTISHIFVGAQLDWGEQGQPYSPNGALVSIDTRGRCNTRRFHFNKIEALGHCHLRTRRLMSFLFFGDPVLRWRVGSDISTPSLGVHKVPFSQIAPKTRHHQWFHYHYTQLSFLIVLRHPRYACKL